MDVTTERHDGVLCARVIGRIEPRNAGEFQTAITGGCESRMAMSGVMQQLPGLRAG